MFITNASNIYFLFCRRRRTAYKENTPECSWICAWLYHRIFSHGSLAGTIGSFLIKYQTVVNTVSGLIVILFGLNFLGVLNIHLFQGTKRSVDTDNMGFFSAALFGMVFSIGWTPCVGAFLGSALMLASTQAHMVKGVLMLLSYSLGLGIPFIVSAVLIDKLKGAFNFIKRNYEIINKISGAFLILVGLSMATGLLGRLLSLLS